MEFASPNETDTDLSMSGAVVLGIDQAEIAAAKRRVRKSKSGGISKVEELGPQLEIHTFPEIEALENGKVEVVNAIAAQVGEIAGSISRNLITGIRKGIDIEEISVAIDDGSNIGSKRTALDVRALIAVGQPPFRHMDSNGIS